MLPDPKQVHERLKIDVLDLDKAIAVQEEKLSRLRGLINRGGRYPVALLNEFEAEIGYRYVLQTVKKFGIVPEVTK